MQYRAELDYVIRNVDCIVDIKHDQNGIYLRMCLALNTPGKPILKLFKVEPFIWFIDFQLLTWYNGEKVINIFYQLITHLVFTFVKSMEEKNLIY